MPTPNSPIAFTVFGIPILWYGILIATAIVIATVITCRRAPLHQISGDRVLDFVLICLPVGLIGARLYYVAFNWEDYAGDFLKIINTRGGGLAIHGGLIFGILTAIILCRLWTIRPLNILDLVAPALALAQAIGRWGNYTNSEAHGGPTDLPWGIMIDGQAVHPTFLYESIWCFALFFFLLFIDNRRKFEGQVILLYGILYSLERFFVEGLRTDSLMLFDVIRQAQFISILIILACCAGYVVLYKKSKHQGRI